VIGCNGVGGQRWGSSVWVGIAVGLCGVGGSGSGLLVVSGRVGSGANKWTINRLEAGIVGPKFYEHEISVHVRFM
jgi:hypothetical protein